MSAGNSPFKTPDQIAEQNITAAQPAVKALKERVEAEFAKPQTVDHTYDVDITGISEVAIQIVEQWLRDSGWHVRRSGQRDTLNRLYITKPHPGFSSSFR